MRKLTLISLTILLLSLPLATPTLADERRKPYIESCDEYGNTKNVFDIKKEDVYLTGKLAANQEYDVYIVEHYENWKKDKTTLEELKIVEGPIRVKTGSDGKISPPVLIWKHEKAKLGYYDIFADKVVSGEAYGKYDGDDGLDAFDIIDTKCAGFFAISEAPLGPIAMLLACFTAVLLKYRRPLSLRG